MIELKYNPDQKIIELGGGAFPRVHPNCDSRMTDADGKLLLDPQGRQAVDFVADFNKPLPIQSDEWDGVFSHFALEHIAYPNTRQFIKEIFRILKPGGKAIIVTANTEAQLKWIQANPSGWDNEDAFTSCSKILFGGLDYAENSHKAYFSADIITALFVEAGFANVTVVPYGARDTDLCLQAVKPIFTGTLASGSAMQVDDGKRLPTGLQFQPVSIAGGQQSAASTAPAKPTVPMSTTEERAALYDYHYFNTGAKVGGYAGEGYRDFPCHEITAKYVLARRPESVLEIGCARGYVLKRLQDADVVAHGFEISKHCQMTAAARYIHVWDICKDPWPVEQMIDPKLQHDLCLSIGVLEHIPEQFIPAIAAEMARTCKRGLHGITLSPPHPAEPGGDKTICTLRPKEWWQARLPKGHEVVHKDELEQGPFPPEVLRGDGKVKLNIGCGMTMFHHGWDNFDIQDFTAFAQANGHRFQKCDVRQGLPHGTGTVDLILASHFLDYLTYAEGLAFLRECRRVLNPQTGAMRIAVPDACELTRQYTDWDCSNPAELDDFDQVNLACAEAAKAADKMYALLYAGRQSVYDGYNLCDAMRNAGFEPNTTLFRTGHQQILRETLDTFPCYSLYVEAVPRTE